MPEPAVELVVPVVSYLKEAALNAERPRKVLTQVVPRDLRDPAVEVAPVEQIDPLGLICFWPGREAGWALEPENQQGNGDGGEAERLTEVATDLRDTARAQLERGWTEYLQALRSGGVAEAPMSGGIVPELPGG